MRGECRLLFCLIPEGYGWQPQPRARLFFFVFEGRNIKSFLQPALNESRDLYAAFVVPLRSATAASRQQWATLAMRLGSPRAMLQHLAYDCWFAFCQARAAPAASSQ